MKDKKQSIKQLKDAIKNVNKEVKRNPTKIVDKIVKNKTKIQKGIDGIKNDKIQRICKNSFTLLEYAQEKDKQMVSEGLGSFIKNHIGKIIICVLLLVLFLPGLIGGALLGSIMTGGCAPAGDQAVGAVTGGIAGGLMGLLMSPLIVLQFILNHIPGIGHIVDDLSTKTITPIEMSADTLPSNVPSIDAGDRTYVPGHYDGDTFIKGYYK